MANIKISELPLGNLTSTSTFPFVDEGTTYQGAISAITSNSTVEVTYSELVDKITGETLNTGSYYIITDFRTCYDQPDYDSDRNEIIGNNYKQSGIEPIVVLAISSSTISSTAYQPAYPKDRIQYDWTFNTTERTSGVAYGRISERIDEFNNRTDYDHRTILFKRYLFFEINVNSPYDGTVTVNATSPTEMSVTGTGTNFTSLGVGQIIGFQNTDFKAYKISSISGDTEMYITGLTSINLSDVEMYPGNEQGTIYYQNNVTTGYSEYYTFDYNNPNLNNYIGNFANIFIQDENSFILANNTFQGSTYKNNTFGDACYNNSFNADDENNIVGNYFYNNSVNNNFSNNVIGNYFYDNRITVTFIYNRIESNFYNNYLVQNSFYRNNIMNYFYNNIISEFGSNKIDNQYFNNILRNCNFNNNNIGYNFSYNIIYNNFINNILEHNVFNNNIYCHFSENTVGSYYDTNYLGDINDVDNYSFSENKIRNAFESNIITRDFRKNDIGNGFYNNNISGNTSTNRIGEQFENNTIYGDFYDNQIFNEFKGNIAYQDFYENRVDFGFTSNQISGTCSDNSFGPIIVSNDFLGSVFVNTFKGGVYENTIGDNFIDNNIGFGFGYNTIGEGFGYGTGESQGNTIGNGFIDNIIGEYFYNNSISDNFHDNEIGNYFQWNVINTNIDNTYFTLNYGNITGFSYSSSGTTASDNLYNGLSICGTTESMGIDATFNVEVSGGTVTGVSGNTEGRLYSSGNALTILGTQIGGVTGEISGFSSENLSVKIYKPADSTYEFPSDETEMDYLIDNSPLFDTYYSSNIQGVSYSTKTGIDQNQYGMVIDGYIQISSGNTYYFGLSSDDGSDAFINGVKVADWYGAHDDNGNTPGGNQYPILLTAGTYSVKVRLQEINGQDIVSLLYSLNSGSTWNIIPNSWFTFSATGTTGSYPNIVAQGTGSGENATFDVTVVDGLVDSVTLSNGGGSYSVGDILTISGSDFGSTEDITIIVDSLYSDDIVIIVTGVTSGSLFYEHYTKQIFERRLGNKRVSFYDEEDILNVDSVYEVSGYIPVYSQSLSFPFSSASFEFECDGSYTNNGGTTNQSAFTMTELVTVFNNNFRQFGYFFDNNDGTIGLYINPSLKQQYCPSGVYTINVFND